MDNYLTTVIFKLEVIITVSTFKNFIIIIFVSNFLKVDINIISHERVIHNLQTKKNLGPSTIEEEIPIISTN